MIDYMNFKNSPKHQKIKKLKPKTAKYMTSLLIFDLILNEY